MILYIALFFDFLYYKRKAGTTLCGSSFFSVFMSEISLKAETLFHIGSFSITNSIVMSICVLLIMVVLGVSLRRKFAMVPGMFQGFFEVALEGLMGLMDSVLGKREKTEKYLPLIATIFLTVITANWLGLLPGVGSIGIYEHAGGREIFVPLFRSPSADLNFTLAIAIIAVVGVNVFGMFAAGIFRYWKRFFTLKNPIYTFVGLLEFISEFAKMVSFSFRLFGNVFAGEVLLTIIGVLAPYFIPLPFLFMEIFVGFIQAFVFATLTLVFISIATAETEH